MWNRHTPWPARLPAADRRSGRARTAAACLETSLRSQAGLRSCALTTCDPVSPPSQQELIYKRGFGKVNKQRIPLTDNSVVEQVRLE